MMKNSSQRITAAIGNATTFAEELRLQVKPRHIFLLFWVVGIVLLGLTGCGLPSLTKTSSSVSLNQGEASSLAQIEQRSSVSQTAFTYISQKEITPAEPSAEPIASGTVDLNTKRMIVLSGIINETSLSKANDLIALGSRSKAPIDILISSPGGVIAHGLAFIQAMKDVQAQGIVIRCHVPILAASMAYVIFTQCNERYTLPYAQLLFHSPRISGTFVITAQAARALAAGMTQLERILVPMIAEPMGIDADSMPWFVQSYNDERLFLATDLLNESPVKWFKVVGSIRGFPGEFPAPYTELGTIGKQSKLAPDHNQAR